MPRSNEPLIVAISCWIALFVLLTSGARGQGVPTSPTPRQVRITMQALHQLGGIPPGWSLTPPSGDAARGRAVYEQLGCHTCHAVRGESFAPPTGPGPELTGMGGHHPAAYFVESIVNPSAVVVDGPGYVGSDGRSTMPSYPDMTLAQLADVVAYLRSLQSGDMGSPMASTPAATGAADADLPAPPPSAARRYLVQAYDVAPGRLQAFEEWFRRRGGAQFLAEPGVVAIDTFVDRTRSGPRLVTVLTFEDDAAFMRFATSPSADQVSQQFDAFIGPHGHDVHVVPPIYRSEALSARR
jgi:mono/diheme cytochrome c family protein